MVNRTERSTKTLAALMTVLGVVCFAPGVASAAFTRPFLRQITGPTGGLFAGPFNGPGGVAVDAGDNLWVSDVSGPPFKLDQFNSSSVFKQTLEIEGKNPPEEGLTAPQSLAINRSTGSFYTTGNQNAHASYPYVEVFAGTGAFVKRFGPVGGEAHVAVDNSAELSAGSVYVASQRQRETGQRETGPTIRKFNAAGEPVPFSGSAEYIATIATNEITGAPGLSFTEAANGDLGGGITVDSHGDIYTTVKGYQQPEESAVLEYSSGGIFLGAFTGQQTPGLGESHGHGGFGGLLRGVAVDPLSGDVLVSVEGEQAGEPIGAVDEFNSSGQFLGQLTATSPGHILHSASEMTVDSHGDLYVVDGPPSNASIKDLEHAVDVYGLGHFVPGLRLGEATLRTTVSAVLNATVNPEALVNPEHTEPGFEAITDCHFEYVTEAAYNATGFTDLSSGGNPPCVPAAGSIPADESVHPVHADLTGLSSGVTYRYRLLATTGGAKGGTAETAALAFTAPHAPAIESTTAANLSSTFADLHATIDPLGADTTYRFEYLTQAEFDANRGSFSGPNPATAVPVPDADIGSGGPTGSNDASVLRHIGGLKASTAYVFRVLATNEIGTTEGPAATFATLPQVSSVLPDNRAYELLTPPDKGGAADMFGVTQTNGEFFNQDVGVASELGDQFLLTTLSAFGPFPFANSNAYVFSRKGGAWAYTSLASPSLGVQDGHKELFDPADFSQVGFEDNVGSGGSAEGSRSTSLLGPPGGPYTTIHADSPSKSTGEEATTIVGGSRDLSHVVLESNGHTLAPGDESQDPGSHALYEYSAGELKLLNVTSKGELLNKCGAELGATAGFTISGGASQHNAVSADGSWVFFTAPDPAASNAGAGCWNGKTVNAPQLYMRSGGQTVEVSRPEEAAAETTTGRHHLAQYVGAAADGSRVFFLSEAELTEDDAGIHDRELYEYDVETAKLTRISAGESGKAAANVFNVPAVSADGSAVYFTAFGALTSGAPATSGEEVNLYRYDTATAATTYVATVNTSDNPGATTRCRSNCPEANWYTAPDGRYLLFATSRELTGYRTVPASPPSECATLPDNGGNGDHHCDELYRYDAAGGGLTCVSCNPSGAPPVSNAEFSRSATLGNPASGPVQAMSADGSYVFFDTADALVPQDTNGTLDVYEWHEGKVSLISSGTDSAPSFFLGASPDGSNVFFGTHARLVPQDTDTAGDVYDARICTETDPCVKPPAGETAQCEGDACQNPPPLLLAATPATFTSASSGNVAAEVKPQVIPKAKLLTRAQKLSRALKACKKLKSKTKRRTCEKTAHQRFGPPKNAKKARRASTRRGAKR